MKIYLANTSVTDFDYVRERLKESGYTVRSLISFYYGRTINFDNDFQDFDIFADSGAFSAWSKGTTIAVKDYGRWLQKWDGKFQAYSNLDVIGDPVATLDNQTALEDMGLDPLPVFHVGAPWEQLESYINKYPYIALGGMVPYMGRRVTLMPWLVQCFKMAEGRSVFHGFGATNMHVLKDLPFYSVDSSAWIAGVRFGSTLIFDRSQGRMVNIRTIDKPERWFSFAPYLRERGFDPANLGVNSKEIRASMCQIAALSFNEFESYLTEKHGEITIPTAGRNI